VVARSVDGLELGSHVVGDIEVGHHVVVAHTFGENEDLLLVELLPFLGPFRSNVLDVLEPGRAVDYPMDQVLVLLEELVLEEFEGGLVAYPFLGPLLGQLADQVFDGDRQVLFVEHYGSGLHLDDVLGGDALEGTGPQQQFVEQDAETVEVDGLVVALLLEHFGSQVLVAAAEAVEFLVGLDPAGEAEVADLDAFVLVDEYVLGLEVSVDQSPLVEAGDGEGDFNPDSVLFVE